MIVVSETSPIVALHHLAQLGLLGSLFGDVLIPPMVNDELLRGTDKWQPVDISQFSFIRVVAPQHPERFAAYRAIVDPGEWEAIALALELGADLLLVDDKDGRSVARQAGIEPMGTLAF